MRLDKRLCKSTGFTSEQATAFILAGAVTVEGEIITDVRCQVHKHTDVRLNGTPLIPRPYRYLLIHKPKNTVCSNIDEAYPSVFNQVGVPDHHELHVVGRLDADTTGLVLATDDGHWSFEIIRPEKNCPKVYRVTLSRPLSEACAQQLREGVLLQGIQQPTLPAKLTFLTSTQVLLAITEGKYHQVKRMFAAVDNRVVALHREQIGEVCLDVEEGQWRALTAAEIEAF
ncbi:MAG: pseudouridine synthase [Oleibacter sp.]|nr:pseudouridine synthase [Thalassolituus sp.]